MSKVYLSRFPELLPKKEFKTRKAKIPVPNSWRKNMSKIKKDATLNQNVRALQIWKTFDYLERFNKKC